MSWVLKCDWLGDEASSMQAREKENRVIVEVGLHEVVRFRRVMLFVTLWRPGGCRTWLLRKASVSMHNQAVECFRC